MLWLFDSLSMGAVALSRSVLVINGPNLNLLGSREPEKYGHQTLAELERLCVEHGKANGLDVTCLQSNHEGELLDAIHGARDRHVAIVINAGAYSHTSIALLDALVAVALPVYEVHLTNIHAREAFRHHSYLSAAATAVIVGLGIQGYVAALDAIAQRQA